MGQEEAGKKSETQTVLDSRLIERFEVHRDFTRVFIDAFVLINTEKKVLKFNQMFCTILGMRAIDVRKAASIDALLRTEMPNSSQTAVEMVLNSTSPVRIDEVTAHKTQTDEEVQLIISSYPYLDDDGQLLGAFLLLRDVTAESNLQGKYKEKAIQSVTDPLSGLFTRRYFEDWIEKEIERCKNQGEAPSLGVLMFDLDKFKSVNDTHGHQAGDFVIAETAKILKLTSRKSDILGRYGGEELIVLLLGTTPRGCCIAAEKFRQAIQAHEYVFEGKRIPISTSVGVSMFLSANETREMVVARADKCLYSAKHGGRNVVFADFGDGDFKVTEELPPELE